MYSIKNKNNLKLKQIKSTLKTSSQNPEKNQSSKEIKKKLNPFKIKN